MENQDQSIQRTFNSFIENYNELERIRKDISNYQKQFKARIDELKKMNQESEKVLLKYLDDNKLPGIRSGDFLILADEKPVPSNKKLKEERLQTVFESNQIHPSSNIFKQVVEILNNPKSIQKMEKKIKCQKYKKKDGE
jgi:Fe2+ transport system protein B